jgi:pimeloyl-ACP methyl ester carboxylesterase
LLVSGAQGAHDDWTHVADTNNPDAAPQASDSAVYPRVARFTRVCAYDRPGTTFISGGPSLSTPVPQPTTARAGVADLSAVLAAAHEPGPYVVVGASWGGMIANLYARTNPTTVSGLVFVDAASEFLYDTLTPAQWTAWMQLNRTLLATPTVEVPDYQAAVDEIRAAPAMPAMPAAVLTADKPWNLPLGSAGLTWPAWTAAQDRLASLLNATHITHTNSSHPINIEQPRTVIDAIHNVVDATRLNIRQSSPTTPSR